jgi:hypothetical protein
MKNLLWFIFCLLFCTSTLFSQELTVISVSPEQDIIGAKRNSSIVVKINKPIDSIFYNSSRLFRIYGSNSGLVNGKIEINTTTNEFIFIPSSPFFCGEIVDVSFGPVIDTIGDTVNAFNWRFTVEITNSTTAQFDSLKRFSYPSYGSIAIDYDKDGDIDIVSASGLIIYNDGAGNFNSYRVVEQLSNMRYFVDVNNDGIEDIITYDSFVYLGDSTGSYNMYQKLNFSGSLIAQGDINGDGFIDLIGSELYTEYDELWRIFINDGTGKFIVDTNAVYLHNAISTNAKLIDMDKDGDLDFVLLNIYSANYQEGDSLGAYVYLNNGRGKFNDYFYAPFRFLSMPDGYYIFIQKLYVIDYDKNGLNDIAGLGSEEGGLVLMQNPVGIFTVPDAAGFCGAENGASFTSGDVNGDNRFDIITSDLQVCRECANGEVTMQISINNDPIDFENDTYVVQLGLRSEVGSGVTPVMADVDNDGDLDILNTGYPTNVNYNHTIDVGIQEENTLPKVFSVLQNYPNPFNPSTVISYSIPSAGYVTLKIYNLLGELVKVVINGYKMQGNHSISLDFAGLNSGVFFYRVEFNGVAITKKMTFLK